MENIVCVGELITDYFYHNDTLELKEGGGTAFNVAHHLKDIFHVEIVGYVGKDEDGNIARSIAVKKQILLLDYFTTRCSHIYVENGKHRISCPGKHPLIKEDDFNKVLTILDTALQRLQHGILVIDELSTYSYAYITLANKYDFKVCLDIGYVGRIESEGIARKILEHSFFYIQTNTMMYQYIKKHKLSLRAKHIIISDPSHICYHHNALRIFHPVSTTDNIVSQIGAGDALMAEMIRQLILQEPIDVYAGEKASKEILAILSTRR